MTCNYYNRAKMTQIILDLIYLHQEMTKDGYTDRQSCLDLLNVINTLQYYLQFLEPHSSEPIRYYKVSIND